MRRLPCPCGGEAIHVCAHCNRLLCMVHWAAGFFHVADGTPAGAVDLRPVCLPRCEDPQWATARERSPVPTFHVSEDPVHEDA